LNLDQIVDVVAQTTAMLEVDILIVGAREVPPVFEAMIRPGRRAAKEVFLWYNLLSDIEGMTEADLVINWRGDRSRGWGGWESSKADVDETFRFACPNNPAAREKTLGRLRRLLGRYRFDGVFLDKLRFPSPANGLDEVLSCFCGHCHTAAAATGLDLDAVRLSLQNRADGWAIAGLDKVGEENDWLATLAASDPLLTSFLNFRRESITNLVAAAYDVVSGLGRKVSLDLFSPGLASVVGQDYRALSRYCAWAKPMTYRVAKGPAGLRLEIPALAEGIAQTFGLDERTVSQWATAHVKGFNENTIQVTRDSAVPLPVMSAEVSTAVNLMGSVPVYFGLELVRHPGVIDITSEQVMEMMKVGRANSAAGVVISWDLMHAPLDLIKTLASVI
jgi:hypothetical protein